MLALMVANRKKLLISVGLCCLPYTAFGMEDQIKDDRGTTRDSPSMAQIKNVKRRFSSAILPNRSADVSQTTDSQNSGLEKEFSKPRSSSRASMLIRTKRSSSKSKKEKKKKNSQSPTTSETDGQSVNLRVSENVAQSAELDSTAGNGFGADKNVFKVLQKTKTSDCSESESESESSSFSVPTSNAGNSLTPLRHATSNLHVNASSLKAKSLLEPIPSSPTTLSNTGSHTTTSSTELSEQGQQPSPRLSPLQRPGSARRTSPKIGLELQQGLSGSEKPQTSSGNLTALSIISADTSSDSGVHQREKSLSQKRSSTPRITKINAERVNQALNTLNEISFENDEGQNEQRLAQAPTSQPSAGNSGEVLKTESSSKLTDKKQLPDSKNTPSSLPLTTTTITGGTQEPPTSPVSTPFSRKPATPWTKKDSANTSLPNTGQKSLTAEAPSEPSSKAVSKQQASVFSTTSPPLPYPPTHVSKLEVNLQKSDEGFEIEYSFDLDARHDSSSQEDSLSALIGTHTQILTDSPYVPRAANESNSFSLSSSAEFKVHSDESSGETFSNFSTPIKREGHRSYNTENVPSVDDSSDPFSSSAGSEVGLLPLPFQKQFMSEYNDYLEPQSPPASKDFGDQLKDFVKSEKEQINEKIQLRFSSMQFNCMPRQPKKFLDSLALAFYIETADDKSIDRKTRIPCVAENIKKTKPEELLNKFWKYDISKALTSPDYLNNISHDTLELIASSAIFLATNMSVIHINNEFLSPKIKNAYIICLYKNFIDCCSQLFKKFPNTPKYNNYYHYYSAKYFKFKKEFEIAWWHLIQCDTLARFVEPDPLDPKSFGQELLWIRQLRNEHVFHLPDDKVMQTLQKAYRYLEIARITEEINLIEYNKSNLSGEIKGLIDLEAAYYYLESAKYFYTLNKDHANTEMKKWRKEMLLHLARKADSLAFPNDQNGDSTDPPLHKISNDCYDLVHEMYEAEALGGNSEAIFNLGRLFELGYGVRKSDIAAAEFYKQAAELGNTNAQYYLGVMYFNGEGTAKNYVLAATYFQDAAKQGNSEAQYSIASMYEKGLGVKQDINIAKTWYEEACKRRHIEAYTRLGRIYEEEEKDNKKASKHYKKAARGGDATAQIRLSLMYKEGRGVGEDPLKAFQWCEESANQENAEAEFVLGKMYGTGYVKKNNKTSVKYYKKSAFKGYAAAQYELGLAYAKSGVRAKNLDKALKWHLLAAAQGHEEAIKYCKEIAGQGVPAAQAGLGKLYEEGFVIEKDINEAVKYYKSAAKQKNAQALFYLASLYYSGRGVEEDKVKALEYFEGAALEGHLQSQLELGKIYEEEGNIEKAVEWYKKAADAGDKMAQYTTGQMYAQLGGDKLDLISAIRYCALAADQGHTDAQYELGLIYAGNNEKTTAFKYFELAADKGHAEAQIELGILYANGDGVEINETLALQCFEEAALEDPKVLPKLGLMYEEGKLLRKDLKRASELYKAAYTKGILEGAYRLALMHQKHFPRDEWSTTVFQLFFRAADKGHPGAQYNLGWMYHYGQGIDQDIDEAVKWYSQAAEGGNQRAMDTLNLMSIQAATVTSSKSQTSQQLGGS